MLWHYFAETLWLTRQSGLVPQNRNLVLSQIGLSQRNSIRYLQCSTLSLGWITLTQRRLLSLLGLTLELLASC